MKTSNAIIIASIIFLVGIVFYCFANRYYIQDKLVLDRFTGDVYRVSDKLK